MLRPNQEVVVPRFLMMQLMAPPVLDVQLLDGLTGTTSRHLNIRTFKRALVTVPSLDSQAGILSRLDSVLGHLDEAEARQRSQARNMDSVLPSALSRWVK